MERAAHDAISGLAFFHHPNATPGANYGWKQASPHDFTDEGAAMQKNTATQTTPRRAITEIPETELGVTTAEDASEAAHFATDVRDANDDKGATGASYQQMIDAQALIEMKMGPDTALGALLRDCDVHATRPSDLDKELISACADLADVDVQFDARHARVPRPGAASASHIECAYRAESSAAGARRMQKMKEEKAAVIKQVRKLCMDYKISATQLRGALVTRERKKKDK